MGDLDEVPDLLTSFTHKKKFLNEFEEGDSEMRTFQSLVYIHMSSFWIMLVFLFFNEVGSPSRVEVITLTFPLKVVGLIKAW